MSNTNVKDLVFGFVKFIDQASQNSSLIAPEGTEGLEIAKQCLLEAFDISDDYKSKAVDFDKTSLLDIFNKHDASASATPKEATSGTSPETDKKQAEEFKAKGNSFMATRDYENAIEEYTKAIELDNSNSIYFANRSAAYSQLSKFEEAEADAQLAVDIDPTYAKAYSRLGHACYGAEKYSEAVDAYQEALNLDPSNQSTKSFLQAAQAKLDTGSQTTTNVSRGMGAGGMGAGGMGAGGMPDLSSLLSNPALASMAQNLMSSGAMDHMMKNPEIAKMAESFKSTGKMPTMDDIMGNPAMREMAGKFGAGATPPPNSDSGSGTASADPLSNLLNNPDLMNMASKFMQGSKKQ